MGSVRVALAGAGVLVTLLAVLTGCSSTWGKNRLEDLTDVVHLGIGACGMGVHANAGPLVLGAMYYYGFVDGDRAVLFCLGPGGARRRVLRGGVVGLGVPIRSAEVVEKRQSVPETRKLPVRYGDRWPPWGSIGIDVAFYAWLSFRLDFVELADFLAGLFSLDPAGDDLPWWPGSSDRPPEMLPDEELEPLAVPAPAR